MRNLAKKKAQDGQRHKERMKTDLDYRLRKLLNTMRARCNPNSKRPDREWYVDKGLQVTVTVEQLKEIWFRDGAGKMKSPDADRKERHLGYTYDNIRFIEHADNLRKMIATRKPRRWYRKPAEAEPVQSSDRPARDIAAHEATPAERSM